MKKQLIITMALFLSFSSFSQEKTENISRQETQPIQPVKAVETEPLIKESQKSKGTTISKRAGQEQEVHNATYYQKEISKIDNHIIAIDTKIEFVNNDPTEKALAESNGWFTDMNSIKAELQAKKTELENKLNNL